MSENARDIIQDLIETCKDGETGYLHAYSIAEDPNLKSYFQKKSIERGRMKAELAQLIEQMGVPDPDESGSTTAVLHRAWFELKNDMGGGDHTLLESVEHGEDSAKKSYEEALSAGLPSEVETLVRRQYSLLKGAHDQVRNWRDDKAA